MLYEYRVGSLYSKTRTRWEEGVEYNYHVNVHEIRMFFRTPKPIEVQSVKQGEATFGLAVDQDVILLVFKFGALPYSDASYTWHRVPQEERTLPKSSQELAPNDRALVTVFLVNADTGILLAIRQVTLSHDFTCKLHDAIIAQSKRPFDQVLFDRQLRMLYAQYQSKDLMKLASVKCKGGE